MYSKPHVTKVRQLNDSIGSPKSGILNVKQESPDQQELAKLPGGSLPSLKESICAITYLFFFFPHSLTYLFLFPFDHKSLSFCTAPQSSFLSARLDAA